MRSEALLEISSEQNFSLKLYIPLVLRTGFLTVDELPFLDLLITLGNFEEESGFECSFLEILEPCLCFQGGSHQD